MRRKKSTKPRRRRQDFDFDFFIFFFSQNLVSDEIFISAEIGRNDPKYAEIFFFSSLLACWKRRSRVGAVSEPCWRCVGACRRNEKKKKEDTRRTPESGESYPFRCLTRVRHRHDAKNGVSVQRRIQLVWGRRTSKYMFGLGMSNIAKIFNLKKN